FPSTFPGHAYLPSRKMRRLHKDYDKHAIQLLMNAGLRSKPGINDLERWIQEGLNREECLGLLKYLAENQRGLTDYYHLSQVLQGRWFPSGTDRVTTAEAYRCQLIPEEIVSDPVYCAWLGIVSQPTVATPILAAELRLHPGQTLE